MKRLKVYKYSIIGLFVLSSSMLFAQKKYVESFKASDDIVISVNTSHTNVVFETWNKNKIEVEAFIKGDELSAKEKQEIFDHWKFNVIGNSKEVIITSNAGNSWNNINTSFNFEGLDVLEGLEGLDVLKNLNIDIIVPEIPEFKNFPRWPFSDTDPNIKSGDSYKRYNFNHMNNVSFDGDEYKKNKKAYVAKLNKKNKTNVSVQEVDNWLEDVDNWSEEFEAVMEDWGENFGKEFEMKFGPEFEEKMEKWGEEFGEKFGEKMEKWGEEFGEKMEKWGEKFEEEMSIWEEQNGNNGPHFEDNSKAVKTIIIRMPKGTKTDVNVRHGELKIGDAFNLNATLNYSTFLANSIDGGETLINASYAPVLVNNWINGDLIVKYVKDCTLNTVAEINLNANSSDVNIINLIENAYLSGSFGNLYINTISDDFEFIDIVLENTDAVLSIPNTAFNFTYNGKRSRFNIPTSLKVIKENKNNGLSMFRGYHKSKDANKSINISASYSNLKFH